MNRYKQVVTVMKYMDETTIIELPANYWNVVRQVLESTLTAKGADGAKMLHEIFTAFDNAGIEHITEEPESLV